MSKTISKKLQGALLLILAASLALITSTDSGFFRQWENRSWDLRLRLTADSDNADSDIKLILVDQRSIEQIYDDYGISWPFPRQLFASTISYLGAAQARGVAIDHVFSEPSFYGTDDDRALFSSPPPGLKVVYAFSPHTDGRSSRRAKAVLGEKLAAALDLDPPFIRNSVRRSYRFRSAALPLPDIIRSSDSIGAVIADPDSDGIIRRYPEGGIYLLDQDDLPDNSPADSNLDPSKDVKNGEIESESDNGTKSWPFLSLGFSLYRSIYGDRAWRSAEQQIPEASPLLNFHGPTGTYASYSFGDIVSSWKAIQRHAEPIINPAEFKDSLVFVGVWAPGLMDRRLTPLDSSARAVDIHATALDNLIHHNFARQASKASSFLISFLFLSIAIFSSILPRHLSVQLFGIAAATAGMIGIAVYEAELGIWIELVGPLVIQTVAVVTALAYEYAVEGREHRYIKEAFRHYVSPDVIDSIVADPAALTLGGERRELTMFFSDIVGFIAISERLDPAEESKLLNEYLSLCAETILARKGTVDKFVGDGIVAFWNAPVHEPTHALLAVETAVEIQNKLEAKQIEWKARFGSELRTRIGLHTGTVNVGNFGASFRFSYTVIGDAANLASRLEGANRVFGTSVIVSGATKDSIRENMTFRRIGRIRVAGRTETVEIYEPLELSALRTPGQIDQFNSSLSAFESGNYESARAGFVQLESLDPVAAVYLRRIATIGKSGPGIDPSFWDLTDK